MVRPRSVKMTEGFDVVSDGCPMTALAVCGPTASGKSALAITLCRELAGEVVNLDSVQVYRGLNIGSAKLSPEDQGGIPHHLLDIFEPDFPANVATFREAAILSIRDIVSRGRLSVLAGGTGMYLTVLLQGLADVPGPDAATREMLSKMSNDEMYAQLTSIDPVTAARLSPRDRQRLERALEIWFGAHTLPSRIFEQHRFARAEIHALILVVCRSREELYARIDARAKEMMDRGLVEETRGLVARYGRPPVMSSLGYKQALSVLDGDMSESDAVAEIAQQTRRFAKRQMTYFRNEPPKRGWVTRPRAEESAVEVPGGEPPSKRQRGCVKGFRAFDWSSDKLVSEVRSRLTQGLERTEVWYVLGR